MMNVVVMETAPMQMIGSAGMQWTDLSVPGFAPGIKGPWLTRRSTRAVCCDSC